MKTLFTLDIKNYDPGWKRSERHSARAIIRLSDGRIALVYARNLGYYKFPGGGIHEGEDKIAALVREVAEETGLVVVPESVREYGVTHRFQKSTRKAEEIFVQDSFYYICDVERSSDAEKGRDGLKITRQNLDDYEDEAGFELRVVTLEEAISANRAYTDSDAFNIVMIARDLRVLEMLAGVPSEPSKCMVEFLRCVQNDFSLPYSTFVPPLVFS